MSTIANAKVAHNYNRYNGYFFGCLRFTSVLLKKCKDVFLIISSKISAI